tara:strand:- start:205 stop:477 length:273 start_codon:yes stop_codon:yes gene_type:complete
MQTELHEGVFVSEGHFIEFRLGNDELVWVDEALSSEYKLTTDNDLLTDKIFTQIYELDAAMDLQKDLIDRGYNFFPDFELSRLRDSVTIH